jgi:hypothetical protein
MTKKIFKHWNWEYDYGEQPLPENQPLPPEYAIAYFDYKGRLYRVIARVKLSIDRSDDDPSAFYTSVYDYFCDENGRILQKRSLGDESDDGVIVDLEYDDEKQEVTETAWSPIHGLGQKHTRKQKRSVSATRGPA